MINLLLRMVAKFLLWLRYRVRITGLGEAEKRGTTGVLFLPNHPALIDPFIVLAALHRRFAPRSLADREQIDRPFVRWMAKRVGARLMPSIAKEGPAARGEIERLLAYYLTDNIRQKRGQPPITTSQV